MAKNCLVCSQKLPEQLDLVSLFSLKKPSANTKIICDNCQKNFIRLGEFRCPLCDRTMVQNELCFDCQRWKKMYQENILRNHSLYEYDSGMHELIKNYKKYGDYELRLVLQELIKNELNQYKFDFYIPLPTDPKHIEERGFDTIQGIFEEIVPLTNVLAKLTSQKAQSQKNRLERMQTRQTFYLNQKVPLRGRVLLLDDLYTTGRTMYHARDVLLSQYPKCEFESFCIIR